MQRFEKPHAVREPQFGHTWCRFSLDENISVLFCCSITIACDIIIWLMSLNQISNNKRVKFTLS